MVRCIIIRPATARCCRLCGWARIPPTWSGAIAPPRPKKAKKAPQQSGFKARIFVSAANTNNVYSVAVSDSGDLRVVETINVSTTPNHPLGMTPSALALSADQSRLYVVCSDANAAAVVDVTEARSQVLGFVPTGWYPTAAQCAGRRPPGGAERQRLAQLSESQRAESDAQTDRYTADASNMSRTSRPARHRSFRPLTDESLARLHGRGEIQLAL